MASELTCFACLHTKLTEQHVLQNQEIDLQAMLVALVACLVLPLPHLNRHKPAFHLFTLPAAAVIVMNVMGVVVLDASYMALLLSRAHGGTSSAYMVSQPCLSDHVIYPGMLLNAKA